jgi:hypothetical protein
MDSNAGQKNKSFYQKDDFFFLCKNERVCLGQNDD